MITKGDIVERIGGEWSCGKGRVTGFAPNGHPRVRTDDGQHRIWPTEQTRVIRDIDLTKLREIEQQRQALRDELEKFVARIGVERAERLHDKIARSLPSTHTTTQGE